VVINYTTASSRKSPVTSRHSAAVKTKMASNVLFYTQEAKREISEIHNMISETMSRLETLKKERRIILIG
jgi:hypothetical protein